ncbi:hypothetical protein chiPu_0028297 [Chiloscyllium punctatum]|uniref:Uncharacterized protein n=1 Tax=Chiloscyllium punctatum TaxID=137246 RepID=A0A401TNG2_CHIPU|nr:hypothetical protein [Chiloscyllium punctatum]
MERPRLHFRPSVEVAWIDAGSQPSVGTKGRKDPGFISGLALSELGPSPDLNSALAPRAGKTQASFRAYH